MKLSRIFGLLSVLAVLVSTIGVLPAEASTTRSPSTDWTYIPMNVSLQLTADMAAPNGIPLCTSASYGTLICYTPRSLKKAYSFPSTATLDGAGQTIVIVVAFGSPTIASDLARFDAFFGFPDPPSFTIFCGNSKKPFDPASCPQIPLTAPGHNLIGWGEETSLDVEYAHAMAPGANIVLDVAASGRGNAINDAEAAAIAQYPGAIFTQSFGVPEIYVTGGSNNSQLIQAQRNYAAGVAKGDTFFAAAGDTGADSGFGTAMSLFPASDPHNTSVTGTQGMPYIATGDLQPCPSSTPFGCSTGLLALHGPCILSSNFTGNCAYDGYGGGPTTNVLMSGTPTCGSVGGCGEQVWNEPGFEVATGGAQSLLFGVPSYQNGLGLTARGPDVDYNAALNGGAYVVYSGFGFPAFFTVGGTSAGSPQWAAITALANQARANLGKGPIGDLNPVLYSIYHSARYTTDFHDITVGNNQLVRSLIGYSATPGYDAASGMGTPVVDQLIIDLAAAP